MSSAVIEACGLFSVLTLFLAVAKTKMKWNVEKCNFLRTKEEHLLVNWLKCVNFKYMYLVHKSVGALGYIHHGNGFETFVYWMNPQLQPQWTKICTGLL